MPRLCCILALFTFLVSCAGNGVTVQKSQTVEYLSRAYSQSRNWLNSKRNTDDKEVAPPPSSYHISEQDAFQKRSNQRMSQKDYLRAIARLEKSIPELEKEFGKNGKEIGETYFTLGSLYLNQGNRRHAKDAFRKSLKILSLWLGSEHPRVWKLKDTIKQLD